MTPPATGPGALPGHWHATEQRLSAAKLWLTAESAGDAPYLSSAVYALTVVLTEKVAAMTADDRWRLYANPDWVDATDIADLAGEIAHLLWHLLRDHAGRARDLDVGAADAAAWRQAADLTVTDTLLAAGHPTHSLPTARRLGVTAGQSVEQYYAQLHRLPVHMEATPGDDPDSDSHADDRRTTAGSRGERGVARDLDGCGSVADGIRRGYETAADDADALDPVRGDELRQTIAIAFRGHMGRRGDTPGDWQRWVAHTLDPRIPWEQVLRTTVRAAIGTAAGVQQPTYRRPSRRAAASPHVVLPGTNRPVPSVAVVVDTSASMDDGLLAQAVGEIDAILRSVRHLVGGLNVFACDAAAHHAGKITTTRELTLIGGGGTDLSVGITAALATRPRPEVLVVLTDGDTPWPLRSPARCLVIAGLITRQQPPPAVPPWVRAVVCDGIA